MFGGVMRKLPNLRLAFAHGGGSFPITVGRIQHGFDVRPDLCAVDNDVDPRSYLGRFYLDSLVHDADAHIMELPDWLRDHADPDIHGGRRLRGEEGT